MSHFSNALQLLIEKLQGSRAALAARFGIPPSTLHYFAHGKTTPDVTTLEKICAGLDAKDRCDLVVAHLKDETPPSAVDLVRILSVLDSPSAIVQEEPPIQLPRKVREDFDFLERLAVTRPEVVDSIRSTVRILRGH